MDSNTKIITVEQMRKSDAYTIEHFTDSKTLMYRAAKGIYDSYSWKSKETAIICGSGNNGGDGYALACIMADAGLHPHIYRVSEKFSEDGKFYYDMAKEKGVKDFCFNSETLFESYDVLVDCILGTGFKGEPIGNAADAIRRINESGAYVICADINSGLDGNTGNAVLAVRSNLTVSVGYYKKGMFEGDAGEYIGELVNVDIGIVLV